MELTQQILTARASQKVAQQAFSRCASGDNYLALKVCDRLLDESLDRWRESNSASSSAA